MKQVDHHQRTRVASPRFKARFRGRTGLRGWCPGCGRRLVEFQLCAVWPDWAELPDFGTRYYRCPGLKLDANEAALSPAKPLLQKDS